MASSFPRSFFAYCNCPGAVQVSFMLFSKVFPLIVVLSRYRWLGFQGVFRVENFSILVLARAGHVRPRLRSIACMAVVALPKLVLVTRWHSFFYHGLSAGVCDLFVPPRFLLIMQMSHAGGFRPFALLIPGCWSLIIILGEQILELAAGKMLATPKNPSGHPLAAWTYSETILAACKPLGLSLIQY